MAKVKFITDKSGLSYAEIRSSYREPEEVEERKESHFDLSNFLIGVIGGMLTVWGITLATVGFCHFVLLPVLAIC